MKRRIAVISEHASPLAILGNVDSGGQNVYVAEVCKELAKIGFQIDIFTRRDDSLSDEIVHWQSNIRVIHVTAGPAQAVPKEQLLSYMPEFLNEMLRFILKENIRYDLTHANFFMSAWVSSQLKRILGIPYVVTYHALGLVRRQHQKDQDAFPLQRIAIEKFTMKDADAIIAECPQDRADCIELYGAAKHKISIIPCGFSSVEFYPLNKKDVREILQIPHHEKVMLQLGRMVPRKGIDNVIRAVGKLKDSISNLRLLIVGGENDTMDLDKCPELKRLKQIALEEGVEEHVTFVGKKQRDELKYYYAASDLFITTPWYEPFGITPLESMACGTPVIGAKVGGIKYSIAHGKTGLLVPPKDPEALAESMARLLQNPALLQQMSKNALHHVNEYFTWSKVAAKMKTLFETAINKRAYLVSEMAETENMVFQKKEMVQLYAS